MLYEVITGKYSGVVDHNSAEVDDYNWIKLHDILENMDDHPEKYTYWFRYILENYRITSYNVCYTKLLRCITYQESGVAMTVKSTVNDVNRNEDWSQEALAAANVGLWVVEYDRTTGSHDVTARAGSFAAPIRACARPCHNVRQCRITSYNVCYTKLLRHRQRALACGNRAAD